MFARTTLRFALAVLLLAAGAAHAQLFRAYLASDGSDANPCTLPQPCRLLPAALTAVASGGEIWMLDSANYNTATVNIAKSVSILAVPGVVGSLVALNSGPAVHITTAGLTIALRNVVMGPVAGAAPGSSGVFLTAASNLTIEDSLLANLPFDGVTMSGAGSLRVVNTTVRNSGNAAFQLTDGARAVIVSTRMLDNAAGGVQAASYAAASKTTATLTDCVISGGNAAVQALADPDASARISITRTTIERVFYALGSTGNGNGVATVDIGGSLIVDNHYRWYVSGTGATILSLGNNQITDNFTQNGSLTTLAPQ